MRRILVFLISLLISLYSYSQNVQRIVCPNCGGKGYVTVLNYGMFQNVYCPQCGGKGFLIVPVTDGTSFQGNYEKQFSGVQTYIMNVSGQFVKSSIVSVTTVPLHVYVQEGNSTYEVSSGNYYNSFRYCYWNGYCYSYFNL